MGVDSRNPPSQRGRRSVRITSKESYVRGLIVLDLAHAPGSVCGTWPALYATFLLFSYRTAVWLRLLTTVVVKLDSRHKLA